MVTAKRASHVGRGIQMANTHPILDWLRCVTANAARAPSHDGSLGCVDSMLTKGWHTLRRRFRAWTIDSSERFVEWSHEQGYRATSLFGHLNWRCQEYILDSCRGGCGNCETRACVRCGCNPPHAAPTVAARGPQPFVSESGAGTQRMPAGNSGSSERGAR